MLISFEDRSTPDFDPTLVKYTEDWKWLILWQDDKIAEPRFKDIKQQTGLYAGELYVIIGSPTRIWKKSYTRYDLPVTPRKMYGDYRISITEQHWYCESMFYIKNRNN